MEKMEEWGAEVDEALKGVTPKKGGEGGDAKEGGSGEA